MKITMKWLEEQCACDEGKKWFKSCKVSEGKKVVQLLMKENKFSWANWLIVRLMSHKNKVRYAVFSAEQVIKIFEKKYPKDNRPRKAIEAAKAWIENPTKENRAAADAAAAAYSAYSAYSADAADAAAAYSAYSAYSADAADAAAAADSAADAAAYSAAAAEKIRIRIINYGLKLLKENRDAND